MQAACVTRLTAAGTPGRSGTRPRGAAAETGLPVRPPRIFGVEARAIASAERDLAEIGHDQTFVRDRAAERKLTDELCDTAAEAVRDADLVIFCVPPGAMGAAATEIAQAIPAHAVVSDVGSSFGRLSDKSKGRSGRSVNNAEDFAKAAFIKGANGGVLELDYRGGGAI